MKSKGFPYAAHADARILILGSLPGKVSLERREYYALPRNAFWPIMAELAGVTPDLAYAERLLRLNQHGIALWDVCATGLRPGSLDSAIEKTSIETNDFNAFFTVHTQIKRICFNGTKAYDIYKRMVLPNLFPSAKAIERLLLPSTSPAHAGMSFQEKLSQWRRALEGDQGL